MAATTRTPSLQTRLTRNRNENAPDKLPVTPGTVIPAREQLGQMLVAYQQWDLAAGEFRSPLVNSAGRSGAIVLKRAPFARQRQLGF